MVQKALKNTKTQLDTLHTINDEFTKVKPTNVRQGESTENHNKEIWTTVTKKSTSTYQTKGDRDKNFMTAEK